MPSAILGLILSIWRKALLYIGISAYHARVLYVSIGWRKSSNGHCSGHSSDDSRLYSAELIYFTYLQID